MNKRIGRFLVAATIATMATWSAGAIAELKNLENAYESDPSRVVLPSGVNGQVVVSPCSGCSPVVLRVNNATIYRIGGSKAPPVKLEELRLAAAADGAKRRLLTVYYDIESNVATRIVLNGN